jgi:uncharacterized membrane protein YozB (DUF420 family)
MIERMADIYEGWAIKVLAAARSLTDAKSVLFATEGCFLFVRGNKKEHDLVSIAASCEAKAFISSPAVQHVVQVRPVPTLRVRVRPESPRA